MRWPWRRRGTGGRVVFIGSSPFDVRAALDAVPTPSPVVAAWIPDEAPAEPVPARVAAPPEATPEAPPAAPAPPPAAPAASPPATAPPPAAAAPALATPAPSPRPGVQLGFADGTVLTLDDDDPRAVALRATAARLTGTS